MSTMQLNIDPVKVLLPAKDLTASKTSDVAGYSMFTTIGLVVAVTAHTNINATVAIEVSIDGVTWGAYSGSSVAVAGNVVIPYNISDFAFAMLRVTITIIGGNATFEVKAMAKQG